MTKKEFKRYAEKLANLEKIVENSNDKEKVEQAKEEIFQLSSKLTPEEMFAIDELIVQILRKNS